jgi:hypothetical protein
MSVQRSIAQRNNNNSQIIPEYVEILPNTNSSGAALYTLSLPDVQHTKGIFYVDMGGRDTSGNLLNLDGEFYPLTNSSGSFINSSGVINIVTFGIDVPEPASYRPGLEFTIFFKNIPYGRLDTPLLTIGLVSLGSMAPIPYIVSPPFPTAIGDVHASVTLKSDGTNYSVVSSGPAGWMGVPALSLILAAYGGTAGPL